jgi:hypothetical protein
MDKGRKVASAARVKLGADLKAAYDSGVSIRTLAEGLGRSYGFVHRILTEAGTTLRSPGGSTHPRPGA